MLSFCRLAVLLYQYHTETKMIAYVFIYFLPGNSYFTFSYLMYVQVPRTTIFFKNEPAALCVEHDEKEAILFLQA